MKRDFPRLLLATLRKYATRSPAEANPLVRQAMTEWGAAWGPFYWKFLACVLIALVFALTYGREGLTIKTFTVTGAVYGSVCLMGLCALLLEVIG